jgi:hypothetical protein
LGEKLNVYVVNLFKVLPHCSNTNTSSSSISWILHTKAVTKHNIHLISHPLYILDLTPRDFFMFLKLESTLKVNIFLAVPKTTESNVFKEEYWY